MVAWMARGKIQTNASICLLSHMSFQVYFSSLVHGKTKTVTDQVKKIFRWGAFLISICRCVISINQGRRATFNLCDDLETQPFNRPFLISYLNGIFSKYNESCNECIFITVLEMTSTLDFLTTGPNADRWLRAHDDPLASIYTFSK